MNYAGDGSEIDEAVKALPVFASHGSHDEGRRGASQREQKGPREKADLNKAAVEDVVDHAGQDEPELRNDYSRVAGAEARECSLDVVTREEEDEDREMECRIEEGVETDKAAETDQKSEVGGETANGGDGERGEQNVYRPVAGVVGNIVDRVGVGFEAARREEVYQPCQRGEAEKVGQDFQDDD